MSKGKALNDSQVKEQFSEQLASGKPFIAEIKDTKNADFRQMMVVQQRSLANAKPVDQVQRLFLGWSDTREAILRAWHNVDVKKTTINPEVGMYLPEGFKLVVIEDCVPESWEDETGEIQYQDPKIYPNEHKQAGEEIKTKDGHPIYRHVYLRHTADGHSMEDVFLSSEDEAPVAKEVAALEAAAVTAE